MVGKSKNQILPDKRHESSNKEGKRVTRLSNMKIAAPVSREQACIFVSRRPILERTRAVFYIDLLESHGAGHLPCSSADAVDTSAKLDYHSCSCSIAAALLTTTSLQTPRLCKFASLLSITQWLMIAGDRLLPRTSGRALSAKHEHA